VLFFCNISPIFIESLWDPGMTNFLQSNQYGNQLLTSSSAGYGPLGGPTNLFLEARPGYAVVNESNEWYSLPYNGETWWAHTFSANGSSYMIIEVEGVTSFNVTLIYPDLERFNYTVSIGINQFSVFFLFDEYEIAVQEQFKQYIKKLVIESLWIQYWEPVTVDFCSDNNEDGYPDEQVSPHVYEKEFFAHGDMALYVYAPGISYNGLYLEIDSHPVQHLHPTIDECGQDQYIAAEVVAEFTTEGYALRYDLPLDDLYEHNTPANSSWNGYHTLKIAVCGEYNNIAPFANNITLSYAVVAYPDDDWDGKDGLSNDLEINKFYNLGLSAECPNTYAVWNVLPEANSADIFESNWSVGS